MSVVPCSETFWMIMSTLTLASASRPKTSAATPGRSGTSRMVTFASDVSCVTPEMIACSIVASASLTIVPGLSLKDERTCSTTPWLRANSTLRSCRTRAPVAAISSISS